MQMWLTDKQITVFPKPFHAKNVFRIEKMVIIAL